MLPAWRSRMVEPCLHSSRYSAFALFHSNLRNWKYISTETEQVEDGKLRLERVWRADSRIALEGTGPLFHKPWSTEVVPHSRFEQDCSPVSQRRYYYIKALAVSLTCTNIAMSGCEPSATSRICRLVLSGEAERVCRS
jgi:hypothetical protein